MTFGEDVDRIKDENEIMGWKLKRLLVAVSQWIHQGPSQYKDAVLPV